MPVASVAWVEVWLDDASSGEYVLVLGQNEDGQLRLTDPQKGGDLVRTFDDYAEATAWLNEDEYERVEGRWHRERVQ